MPNRAEDVKTWHQMSMINASAVRITLSVGIMGEDDHAQFQIEVRDSRTNDLLAMGSRHHVPVEHAVEELAAWQTKLTEFVDFYSGPF